MTDKPNPSWKVNLRLVNPEMAREYLRNNYVNRPINQKTVGRYARDMQHGLWQEPTVIWFNGGKMIDGQHRCSALIEATKEFWFVIIEGVDTEIIDSIDGGARRSDAQRLTMNGKAKQVSGLLGAMLGFVVNYREHRILGSNVSFPEKKEFLEDHPEIEDYATHWNNILVDHLNVKRAVVATFHYLASKIDKEKADEFFSQILLPDLDEGSPMRALREFVSRLKSKQTPGDIRMTGIALLTAWDAFQEGRPLKKIVPSAEVPHLKINW